MKLEKKLKIILCIAIVALITAVSLMGIYTKKDVIFKNYLPDYLLVSEFDAKRVTRIVVNEDAKEIIYDKDGKVVSSIPDGANEEEYTKKEEKINKDEDRTLENYEKVKKIMESRLNDLRVEDYKLRLNRDNGEIIVELGDNFTTDEIIQDLQCKGDFSITDTNDKTVLLDKNDVKEAKVLYSNATESGIIVYLNIEFNEEGAKKLEEISKKYIKPEDEEKKEDETSENSSEDKKNTVTLTIEGTEILSTHFGEEMKDGNLPITIGTAADTSALQTYVSQGEFYAMLINNDEMPLAYTANSSIAVQGNLNGNDMYIIIGAVIIACVASIIYLSLRYKYDGIFASISLVAFISILLLMIRYTKTEISLNSIIGIIVLIVLDTYLMTKMLNNIKKNKSYENVAKTTIKTYLENIEIIIVSLIIGIVFTFMKDALSFSFGMTLFYGIISIGLTNLIFLRTMLLAKYRNN